MAINGISRPSPDNMHMRRDRLPFSIASALGCLLVLVGFIYANWNTSFYVSSASPYPFLNGPGVFQETAHLYGTPAGIWIWITPTAAAIALALACTVWLWNAHLLPLVSIPAGAGLITL